MQKRLPTIFQAALGYVLGAASLYGAAHLLALGMTQDWAKHAAGGLFCVGVAMYFWSVSASRSVSRVAVGA